MELIIRATVIYFFLFAVARGAGKRELAQMTVFELILLVTMGDLVQQGVTQEDMSLTGAMLAVGTIVFWVSLMGWLSFRFGFLRPALEGRPVVFVHDGRVIEHNLKHERITLDEVKEAARHQGIDDLAAVRLALLEPDGRISFIRRDGGDVPGDEDEARAV
jgi:uncharacterized membrane protein YcaP (DUF421 family)